MISRSSVLLIIVCYDMISTSTNVPTPISPTLSPGCQEGHQLGYHSCSFICGLNDQWYPQSDGGGNIPGAPRCQNKGDVVEVQCPQICINGQYLPTPCYYCCQDYSNNHCDITCDFGLFVPGGCDPFIPPTTPPRPRTTLPTPSPSCHEGDSIGYYSCSFICGLNDQWYPVTSGGGTIPPGAQHCGNKGRIIAAECPLICYQGKYQLPLCHRCCQDYSSNHCDITCGHGLIVQDRCDPFNPPTIPPRPPTPQSFQRSRPRKIQGRRGVPTNVVPGGFEQTANR